ncbi:MAG: biotin/lipoyl-binding protein, partial [Dehalococcoidia bacterium]
MLAGLGFGGVKAYQYFYPSTPVAIAPQTAAAARRTIVEQVSLPGTVGAARTARLSFSAASSGVSISGTVRSISVRTGDVVTAGQEVARLDTVSLDLAVQSARSALAVQQLKMKDLLDGPLPADAIAAEQSVLSAMSSLNSAQNTLVTAQTALATLQARTDAATQARNTQSRIDAFQAQK